MDVGDHVAVGIAAARSGAVSEIGREAQRGRETGSLAHQENPDLGPQDVSQRIQHAHAGQVHEDGTRDGFEPLDAQAVQQRGEEDGHLGLHGRGREPVADRHEHGGTGGDPRQEPRVVALAQFPSGAGIPQVFGPVPGTRSQLQDASQTPGRIGVHGGEHGVPGAGVGLLEAEQGGGGGAGSGPTDLDPGRRAVARFADRLAQELSHEFLRRGAGRRPASPADSVRRPSRRIPSFSIQASKSGAVRLPRVSRRVARSWKLVVW